MATEWEQKAETAVREAEGARYCWGGGSLREAPYIWPMGGPGDNGGKGFDCSGFYQSALWRAGIVNPKAWINANASALYRTYSYPIARDQVSLGDGVYYVLNGSIIHVMFALDKDRVIGATGGGRATRGDKPTATVKVKPFNYFTEHDDMPVRIIFGRIRDKYRTPEVARLFPSVKPSAQAAAGTGMLIALAALGLTLAKERSPE